VHNVELQTSSINIVRDIANYKSYMNMNYFKEEFEDMLIKGQSNG